MLLRAKSHLSFGFGTAPLPALVRRAAELGLPALALVDEENLCGQLAFHHLCRRWGVKPVSGVELGGRVVLLARDRAGWSSLCRVVSARRAHGVTGLDVGGEGLEVHPFDPALEVTLLEPADEPLHRLLAARSKREPRPRALAFAPADGAERFTLDLTQVERVLPDAAAPLTALRQRAARKGARYVERVEAELAVFARMRLEPYLGLVAEVCAHAQRRGIAVCVRGSAAGSLAVHLLGASAVDPVAHGLLFERFLHERRASLPDVDLDVDSERRAELIDFVHRRFGRERVAMVCSIVTWQEASAREVTHDPALLARLIGTPRHLAVHPGGVVVADRALDSLVPLERTARGVVVTQLDLRSVGEAGLVKLDLLGNRALTQLRIASQLGGGVTPREDDARTLAALDAAETIGCFQVETPPVRSLLRRLPIRSLDDVTAALAMVRPGPASGDAKEAFIRRARGEEPSLPTHPALAEVLAGSHGLIAYEEDLIRAVSVVEGVSLAEADAVREALAAGASLSPVGERAGVRGARIGINDPVLREELPRIASTPSARRTRPRTRGSRSTASGSCSTTRPRSAARCSTTTAATTRCARSRGSCSAGASASSRPT